MSARTVSRVSSVYPGVIRRRSLGEHEHDVLPVMVAQIPSVPVGCSRTRRSQS